MSNKDISKKGNNSPEHLEDKDLDQVNGGYTEVEWTYVKSQTGSKDGKPAADIGKKGNAGFYDEVEIH
jgi:hypothetical protein